MLLSKTIRDRKTRKLSAVLDKIFDSYQLFTPTTGQPVIVIDGLDNFADEILSVHTVWPVDKNMPGFLNTVEKSIITDAPHLVDTSLKTYIESYVRPLSHHTAMQPLAFDTSSSQSGNVWHHGAVYTLVVKGAPEKILLRCDLTENEREHATIKLHSLAGGGHTVLAFAHTTLAHAITHSSELSKGMYLSFDGFVSFNRMLKRSHGSVVAKIQDLGAHTIIFTGEHNESAYAVAHELGIVSSRRQLLDGANIHTLADNELLDQLLTIKLITRITSHDKKRILTLLASQK